MIFFLSTRYVFSFPLSHTLYLSLFLTYMYTHSPTHCISIVPSIFPIHTQCTHAHIPPYTSTYMSPGLEVNRRTVSNKHKRRHTPCIHHSNSSSTCMCLDQCDEWLIWHVLLKLLSLFRNSLLHLMLCPGSFDSLVSFKPVSCNSNAAGELFSC